MIHTFIYTNHKTGTELEITQFGTTPAEAEHVIRNYNFANTDWSHRSLELKSERDAKEAKAISAITSYAFLY